MPISFRRIYLDDFFFYLSANIRYEIDVIEKGNEIINDEERREMGERAMKVQRGEGTAAGVQSTWNITSGSGSFASSAGPATTPTASLLCVSVRSFVYNSLMVYDNKVESVN